MLKNHLLIAYRTLAKNPGTTFINLAGLSVSLAVFIIILQFVFFELSYDTFHVQADHLYRVESQFFKNGDLTDDWATSSPGYGSAMLREYTDITAMTRIWLWNSDRVVQCDDVKFREEQVVAADNSFFQLFTFPFVVGNPAEALREPNTVVISESYKAKYFGEQEAIGKMLKISDQQHTYLCEVTGVYQDFPENSHLHYNIMFSWATIASHWPAMDEFWYKHTAYTYVSIPSAAAAARIEQQFPALAEKYKTFDALKDLTWGIELVPLKEIHLRAQKAKEVEVKGSRRTIWFMIAMAILIMLIAWINYTNLSTIKSIERLKEAGLRKIMGVRRTKLAVQFFLESALLGGLAVILAIGLVILTSYTLLNSFTGMTIPFYITPALIGIVAVTLLVAVLAAGAYPALWLSAAQPVQALKGDMKNARGSNRLRKVLIACQFMGSIILINVTILIYRQVKFMKNHDTGIATAQTVVLHAPLATSHYATDLESFKEDILTLAAVAHVTYSSSVPGKEVGMFLSNKKKGSQENRLYEMLRTDYDYLNTYELSLLGGRNFSRAFEADQYALIVNETAMHALGFQSVQDALHQDVLLETSDIPYRIIGVAKDFHQQSLENPFTPIMIFISPDFNWIPYGYLSIKMVGGDVSTTMDAIQSRWNESFGESPMTYYFLDRYFDQQYAREESYEKIFLCAAAFALFISCLGLFGLTYYTITLKKKEIGVRKILGASIPSLLALFSRPYFYLLLISFIIVTPASYFILNNWLQHYTFRTELTPVPFLIPLALLTPLIGLTVGGLTFKAALTNPTASIRYE